MFAPQGPAACCYIPAYLAIDRRIAMSYMKLVPMLALDIYTKSVILIDHVDTEDLCYSL